LTTRVLGGLVAGFGLGLILAANAGPVAASLLAVLSPVGAVFFNLIRMTALPLVASMLVASMGSIGASGVIGRVGGRVAALALALVSIAAAATVALASPALARIQIDQAAALALRGGSATAPPVAGMSLPQWLVDLVPSNVAKAASDGAMLPVIIFAVLFGLALARVQDDRRDAVLRVAQGAADAMQRLVAAILELAPIGVFALAAPLAARLGLAAAGAVIAYIVLVVVLTVAIGIALLYPVGTAGGGMPLRAFVAYSTPGQAVAFASRSSVAALPAMLQSAEEAALPPIASRFVLPLAASTFRVGGAVAMPVGAMFLARLYGITLSPAALASIVVASALASFTVPGIPGGSIVAMVPVLTAAGVPVEGLGILLAVDTIPDMFRTTGNATGILALTAVAARIEASGSTKHVVLTSTKGLVDNRAHERVAPQAD
jgi:Na+/H+-dicarboxylate symporter